MVNQIVYFLNKIQTDLSLINSKPNSEYDRFQKIITSLFNIIKNPETLNNDSKQILLKLNQEWENYSENEKIQHIKKDILKVIKSSSINTLIHKPKIGLKIGIFCNLDAPDYNGAIGRQIVEFLNQNIPFITTQSLLNTADVTNENDQKKFYLMMNMEKILLSNAHKWEIYQLAERSSKDEFLVFLPSSLLSNMNGMDKLRVLDFKSDGSLKKKSLSEVLQKTDTDPREKSSILDLEKIFTDNPNLNKLFFLAGHGSLNTIGGLEAENYKHILNFMKKQKCCGLTVSSCFAGGKSSLLNIPPFNKSKDKKKQIIEQEFQKQSFPTIVRSIGDFPTLSKQEAETDIALYFDELSLFVGSPNAETVPQFRKMLERVEGKLPKERVNYVKVYFAHAADSPAGFRSIGEHGMGFPLTYAKLKSTELEGKLGKSDIPLTITNNKYVDIHPLIINIPIVFKQQDPILMSMIPGNSQQYLKSLQLYSKTPLEFIKETIRFHIKAELQVSKVFYISFIMSKEQTFEEVIVSLNPKNSYLSYKFENKYFFVDMQNEDLKSITALQHAMIFDKTIRSTPFHDFSIKASSGGQESEDMLNETLYSKEFWTSKHTDIRKLLLEKSWIKKPSHELLKMFNQLEFTKEEKESFCFFLLENHSGEIAFDFFRENKLDPNIKDFYGNPIINEVLRADKMDFVVYLIENGVDVNAQNREGDAPLHLALLWQDRKMTECLLENSNIQVDIENKMGHTPLCYALNKMNNELIFLLTQKGANIDYKNSKGFTLLHLFVKENGIKQVEYLLEQKSNFTGIDSALTEAIYHKEIRLINKIIDKGGKPFAQDANGFIPLIEAIKRNYYEIVDLLLSKPNIPNIVQDADGVTPLDAAVFYANEKILQLLLAKSVNFPEKLSIRSVANLNGFFSRCSALEKYDELKLFLGNLKLAKKVNIQFILLINLINNNNINFVVKLLDENLINCEIILHQKVQEASQKNGSEQNYNNLIKNLIFSKKINLNLSLLQKFILEGNSSLISDCFENGMLLGPEEQAKAIYYAFLANQPQIVDLLIYNGYKINKNFFKKLFLDADFDFPLDMLKKMKTLIKQNNLELEDLEKKELWKYCAGNNKIGKDLAILLLENGISPIVNQKNLLKKYSEKFKTSDLFKDPNLTALLSKHEAL